MQAVEANGAEMDAYLVELVETGTPKDMSGTAFKFIAAGLFLQGAAAIMTAVGA